MLRTLTFVFGLLTTPAFALSCMPHGVTDAYLAAEASEDGYVPVLGTLTFDKTLVPRMDWSAQDTVPAQTLIPARFTGDALTRRGVDQPFETDVVLEVRCSGPWCPTPQPGRMLGFLRKTAHSYILETNACGGNLFGAPDPGQIKAVRKCLAGRRCVPTPGR